MKNNWSKKTAQEYINKYRKLGFSEDLALRVYTTRLLGRNKELVLHGGGNTSVKTVIKDIDGKNYNVLCKDIHSSLKAKCEASLNEYDFERLRRRKAIPPSSVARKGGS